MKAITQGVYGGPEVLGLADIDRPGVGDDEVLVKVHAAGVDRGVWHLMAGLPYPVRLGFGVRAPKRPVPGMDLAGVVEAVGSRVASVAVGDQVFGIGTGTFAEYAVAPESKLAPKPPGLSFAEAAALGISGLTALQALRDKAHLRPGQSVLVLGASGGVGSYAVQIAKAMGAEVTAVCSTDKVEFVRSLGADRILDYTKQDWAGDRTLYDVIIDIGGNPSLRTLRRALTPSGTAVLVGGETGGRWLGGFDRMLRGPVYSLFVGPTVAAMLSSENREDLLVLAQMVVDGQVRPAVDRVFDLSEAAEALRYLEQGKAQGKVVVSVVATPSAA